MFIIDQDIELWNIIQTGPHLFYTKIDGIDTLKPQTSLTPLELEKVSKNFRAMNLLYCALNADEFNMISACKSVKEIWDKLVVTYEGTSQVK